MKGWWELMKQQIPRGSQVNMLRGENVRVQLTRHLEPPSRPKRYGEYVQTSDMKNISTCLARIDIG